MGLSLLPDAGEVSSAILFVAVAFRIGFLEDVNGERVKNEAVPGVALFIRSVIMVVILPLNIQKSIESHDFLKWAGCREQVKLPFKNAF